MELGIFGSFGACTQLGIFVKLWGLYSTWDFCEALGLVLSGHIKCVLAWTIEWCTLTQTGSKLSACRLQMGLIK